MKSYVEINGVRYELAPSPYPEQGVQRLRAAVGKTDAEPLAIQVLVAGAEESLLVDPRNVTTLAAYTRA